MQRKRFRRSYGNPIFSKKNGKIVSIFRHISRPGRFRQNFSPLRAVQKSVESVNNRMNIPDFPQLWNLTSVNGLGLFPFLSLTNSIPCAKVRLDFLKGGDFRADQKDFSELCACYHGTIMPGTRFLFGRTLDF